MNIANHNPKYMPWAVLIFDLQWRFQELDLCHCKTFPDGGKGHAVEVWRILCDQAVNQTSDSDYRVTSVLCLDFTLDSLSFTGGSADFDSVFIKTWSVSVKRLKLLLLMMYVNSVSIIYGKFWWKKWKHPGIFFPSWYKKYFLNLLSSLQVMCLFYVLKDCGLTSGWNHSKIEVKSEENYQTQMSVKSYWEMLFFLVEIFQLFN